MRFIKIKITEEKKSVCVCVCVCVCFARQLSLPGIFVGSHVPPNPILEYN